MKKTTKKKIKRDKNGQGQVLSADEQFASELLKLFKKHGKHLFHAGEGKFQISSPCTPQNLKELREEWDRMFEYPKPLPFWLREELDKERVYMAEKELSEAQEALKTHTENQKT